MTALLIYLCGIADSVAKASVAFLFIIAILKVVMVLYLIMEADSLDDETDARVRVWNSRLSVWLVVLILCATLIPDSKTISAMVVIPRLIESTAIQEDMPQIYEAAIAKMKESLELTPKEQ